MIIEKIQSKMDDFPNRELRVANYVINNLTQISNLSISQLSKLSNCSISSITRFAKSLDLSGYKELKMEILKYLYQKQDISFEHLINDQSDNTNPIEHVYNSTMSYLSKVNTSLIKTQINQLINILKTSNSIYLYGIGASSIVAMDLQNKLLRLGLKANLNLDTHTQVVSACSLSKGDCSIIISYSGQTKEMVECARQSKNSKATVISITKEGDSPVSNLSDLSIKIPMCEKKYRLGASLSRFGMLLIVDIIYLLLFSSRTSGYEENVSKTFHLIDNLYNS